MTLGLKGKTVVFTRAVILACLLCMFVGSPLTAQEDKDAAQALLKASEQSNIRLTGSPPFELDAKVTAFIQGKPYEGHYRMLWVSPDKWREDVQLPDYRRLTIEGEKGHWVNRSLDHEIPPAADLDDALDFSWRLQHAASSKPEKFKTKTESDVALECSRFKHGYGFGVVEDFCLDPQHGTLAVETLPDGTGWSSQVTSRAYSDFAAFGEKVFPRTIRVLGAKDILLAFSVERLIPLGETTEKDFTPIPGARFWPGCADPERAKMLDQVLPDYPAIEKAARRPGRVGFYAVIEADGRPHDLRVVQSASPAFDAAAERAVLQWKYEPQKCDGMPVPVETYITVFFIH